MLRWMLIAALFLACGGEELPLAPNGEPKTCQPDPTEARAVVTVTVRNEASQMEADLAEGNRKYSTIVTHADTWTLLAKPESGNPVRFSPPDFNTESTAAVSLDVMRGERVTFRAEPLSSLHEDSAPVTAALPVTLDRSCELVLVVGDEWIEDGEFLRLAFTLSHFWR